MKHCGFEYDLRTWNPADAKTGIGEFLTEKTGEAVNFTLIQKHTIERTFGLVRKRTSW